MDNLTIELNGISVTIARDVLDDIDLLEMMGDMEDGNVFMVPKIMKKVYGVEQYESIKAALAHDGRTTISEMAAFFRESFAKAGEQAKN